MFESNLKHLSPEEKADTKMQTVDPLHENMPI